MNKYKIYNEYNYKTIFKKNYLKKLNKDKEY